MTFTPYNTAPSSFNADVVTDFLVAQSDEVASHISDEVLKIADEVTLKDLLNSQTCRCEVISLIQNICKYSRYYQSDDKYELELYGDVSEIHDLLNRKAVQTAFETIYRIKQMTDKGRAHLPMKSLHRQVPSRIAQKPAAKPLSDEQIKTFVQSWIDLQLKQGHSSFSRAELLTWIQKAYLGGDKLTWHPDDLTIQGREENWKSRVSSRLQELQTAEILNFRQTKQLWYIYTD